MMILTVEGTLVGQKTPKLRLFREKYVGMYIYAVVKRGLFPVQNTIKLLSMSYEIKQVLELASSSRNASCNHAYFLSCRTQQKLGNIKSTGQVFPNSYEKLPSNSHPNIRNS